MLEQDRLRVLPIPRQIQDVVARYPGIPSIELPRLIVAAFSSRFPDLRRHASDAQCAVDGDMRWWPTKLVGDLTPGDVIPRDLTRFAHGGEWVTVTRVEKSGPATVDVEFDTTDSVSEWRDHPADKRWPVRALA